MALTNRKLCRISQLVIIFFILVFLPLSAWAAENSASIRVSMSSGSNIHELLIEQGAYQLVDETLGIPILTLTQNTSIRIAKKGSLLELSGGSIPSPQTFMGAISLQPLDKEQLNLIRFNNGRYRDTFRFHNEAEGIRVINELSIEKYLYGVIGPEMGAAAEMEALKAQAVVSRSYALSCISPTRSYDVLAGTSSQLYQGYSAESAYLGSRVVEAVNATLGRVIVFDSSIISAVYHANAGGHTASSENVWSAPQPYLRAVPSPYDKYAYEFPTQTGGWPANTYYWEKTLTLQETQQMVDRYTQSGGTIQIGDLVQFSTQRMDYGGLPSIQCDRITRLDISGTRGSITITKDQIRSVFSLRSTKFDIEVDSAVYVKTGSQSVINFPSLQGIKAVGRDGFVSEINNQGNNLVVKNAHFSRLVAQDLSSITFKGYGHGHGVGMSQWGARGMAHGGASYRDIIEHYYNQGKNDGRLVILPYKGYL